MNYLKSHKQNLLLPILFLFLFLLLFSISIWLVFFEHQVTFERRIYIIVLGLALTVFFLMPIFFWYKCKDVEYIIENGIFVYKKKDEIIKYNLSSITKVEVSKYGLFINNNYVSISFQGVIVHLIVSNDKIEDFKKLLARETAIQDIRFQFYYHNLVPYLLLILLFFIHQNLKYFNLPETIEKVVLIVVISCFVIFIYIMVKHHHKNKYPR